MKKLILTIALILSLAVVFTACGENDAEKEVPDFEAHNININLAVGQEADYTTACKTDKTKATTGKLTVTEVKHYGAGETLPDAKLEALEGYEWIEVKVDTVFEDDNAKEFGIDRSSCVSDYYDVEYYEKNLELNTEGPSTFAVRHNGEEFKECKFIKVLDNEGWTKAKQNLCHYTWYIRVPQGYDGMVIAFFNTAKTWETGKFIYEVVDADTLLFRVK